MTISTQPFSANGIYYSPPAKPIVVICADGSADEYYNEALIRERMPNLKRMISNGYRGTVRSALPSFTNVNNTSIVTGVCPAKHGISGNFFYDETKDEEVMMNSAEYLRTETILASAANSGRKVAVVTAKEKLRDILSHKLKGIAFSAEKVAYARKESHGIDQVEKLVREKAPEIYSANASLFVLRAGISMIENNLADFLYLSLTDYVQHTYSPDSKKALDFYEDIDKELGRLINLDAIVGLTPDHGMNAKVDENGKPNVLYLEEMLEQKFGNGYRVICPITDPYVKHHGALGSYVVLHLDDKSKLLHIKSWLESQEGITEVHDRNSAVSLLEQPGDRTGDLVILSARNVVLGRKPSYHDLTALDGGLRSHGGRYEEMVSMIISHPLNDHYKQKAASDPRNFHIFDYTINGTL